MWITQDENTNCKVKISDVSVYMFYADAPNEMSEIDLKPEWVLDIYSDLGRLILTPEGWSEIKKNSHYDKLILVSESSQMDRVILECGFNVVDGASKEMVTVVFWAPSTSRHTFRDNESFYKDQ